MKLVRYLFVNHEKFTKKTKIKPNDQITIEYHSFKK